MVPILKMSTRGVHVSTARVRNVLFARYKCRQCRQVSAVDLEALIDKIQEERKQLHTCVMTNYLFKFLKCYNMYIVLTKERTFNLLNNS